MKDRKTRWVIVAAFMLTLLGGVAAGMLASRFFKVPAPAAASVGAVPLSEELNLSTAQTEQIRPIWEGMRSEVNDCYRQAQAIDQQRQQALLQLLTPEQKERYSHIDQTYADRYTALTARRQALFDQAIVRTKALLNDGQKHEYEKILSRRLKHPAMDGLTL
jgi:DNA-binding TFAR19-related protein (PDSD5 family)